MTTFVLVHGAWHGGWCYDEVAALIRAEGHPVFTPTLTGLAERSEELTPDVGLERHILDVVAVIDEYELRDIVLVGHSYGGLVVEGAADLRPEAIAKLAFIDGLVAEGETLSAAPRAQMLDAFAALIDPDRPWLVRPLPASYFGLTGEAADLVDARCTPHPLRALQDQVVLTGASATIRNRTYIVAQAPAGPAFQRTADRLASDGDWTVVGIAGGHDLMIDSAPALARTLMTLA